MEHRAINEADNLLLQSLSKAVFYICTTIAVCFIFSTCTVEKDIIVQCEESCDAAGSKMKSATSRECECESPRPLDLAPSPWVLP
jgi:hypothetical protein